jgi:hypothetical protein
VRRGKTPVLTEEQARRLLESVNTSTLVGLRDRALIGRDDLQFLAHQRRRGCAG